MEDNTNWTPFADDNLLGLTDKNLINEYEANGIGTAEIFVFELDIKTPIECLIFAHYEFIKIHPFNNGNGRTGRILMNLVAMKLGFQPLELYHREGESRKIYISAMQSADKGNYEPLTNLITKEVAPF